MFILADKLVFYHAQCSRSFKKRWFIRPVYHDNVCISGLIRKGTPHCGKSSGLASGPAQVRPRHLWARHLWPRHSLIVGMIVGLMPLRRRVDVIPHALEPLLWSHAGPSKAVQTSQKLRVYTRSTDLFGRRREGKCPAAIDRGARDGLSIADPEPATAMTFPPCA